MAVHVEEGNRRAGVDGRWQGTIPFLGFGHFDFDAPEFENVLVLLQRLILYAQRFGLRLGDQFVVGGGGFGQEAIA